MLNEIDPEDIRCGNCIHFVPADRKIIPFTPDCQPGICGNESSDLIQVHAYTSPLQRLEDLCGQSLVEQLDLTLFLKASVSSCFKSIQD